MRRRESFDGGVCRIDGTHMSEHIDHPSRDVERSHLDATDMVWIRHKGVGIVVFGHVASPRHAMMMYIAYHPYG